MKKIVLVLLVLLVACCLTGCQKDAASDAENREVVLVNVPAGLEEKLAAIKAQSDDIKASLEKDVLTQTDMNLKSKELSDLWESAMNQLLEAAKETMTETEMAKLTVEQAAWLAEKNAAVEAAGKEYEGGTMYALITNIENAKMTEERTYQLYELLK